MILLLLSAHFCHFLALDLDFISDTFNSEALVVARCRLPPSDPLVKDVIIEMAELFESKGQRELAANWFVF